MMDTTIDHRRHGRHLEMINHLKRQEVLRTKRFNETGEYRMNQVVNEMFPILFDCYADLPRDHKLTQERPK